MIRSLDAAAIRARMDQLLAKPPQGHAQDAERVGATAQCRRLASLRLTRRATALKQRHMPKRDPEPEPLDEELARAGASDRSANGSAPRARRRGSASKTSRRRPESRSATSRASRRPTGTICRRRPTRSASPRAMPRRSDSTASRSAISLREEMGGQRFASTLGRRVRARRPAADHAQMAGDRRDRRRHRADRADELAQQAVAR